MSAVPEFKLSAPAGQVSLIVRHPDITAMGTLLYTVDGCVRTADGWRLSPGSLLSDERPAVLRMIQGCAIELRFLDGTTKRTQLVTYGVSAFGVGVSLVISDNPKVCITVSPNVAENGVPPGTEIWLPDEDAARSA